MANQTNLDEGPVVRLIADLQADVASQLQELAIRMLANRNTALHEAIVLSNLLYSEAAKSGKVVVKQGNIQKIIALPTVPPEVARQYKTLRRRTNLATNAMNAIRIALDILKGLVLRGSPPSLDPPVLRLSAFLRADVAGQLQELAILMNANQNTALHEAIVLSNLLYSEAAKSGKVVVKQGGIEKVISLPKVPVKIAEESGTLPRGMSEDTDAGRQLEEAQTQPKPEPNDGDERRAT